MYFLWKQIFNFDFLSFEKAYFSEIFSESEIFPIGNLDKLKFCFISPTNVDKLNYLAAWTLVRFTKSILYC